MSDKEEIETGDPDKEKSAEVDSDILDDVDYEGEEWLGEEDFEEEDEAEAVIEEEIPSYVDNGDGTVSDTRNNLMWRKSDSYEEFGYGITWFEAHDYCESVNEKEFAGFDDWRLPSFEDAKSLFSFDKSNHDKAGAEIHIDPYFDSGQGHNTWTFEEKPEYHQYAMKFSFITGNEIWEHKDNEYSHARLVRDDIKDDWEPEWRKDTKKFGR